MTTRTAIWTPGAPGTWTNVHDGSTVTPAPPPAGFWFTVTVGGNDARGITKNAAYNLVAGKLGRNLGGRLKFFDSGSGINAALANRSSDTPSSTEPHPVWCIKSYNAAQFGAFLDGLTAPCSVVWDQEFYSTVQAEWDTYNAMHTTIRAALDAHANGGLVEFQAVSSMALHRTNPGYFSYIDETKVKSWGPDTYNAKGPTPYTAAQLFDDQLAAWTTMKANNPALKWVISEYGISRWKVAGTTLYTGAERVAYMQAHIDYLISAGCSGLTYWATDNSNTSPIKDWSLDKGTAADDYFAAYVADLLDAYPLP